ncbi:hypothetical protein J7E29_13765 [Streptomyces sp. ISL-90]|nr:hypothetical protein [Streptomyces sp. ISL-90]
MIIEMQLPPGAWSGLPRQFPTGSGQSADEWFEELAQAYSAEHGGSLTSEQVGGLRDLVGEARAQISDRDVATLLFRPVGAPVTAVVHVQLAAAEPDTRDAIAHALLPDVPMALPPKIGPIEHATFGTGHKGTFLSGELHDDRAVGGTSYAFAADGIVVHVFTGPLPPFVLGLIEAPLDEVVASMRLLDDGTA